MIRVYDTPRMPQNWSGEAKNFYLALIDVLDSLHLPIEETWLSDKLKSKINAEPEPVPEPEIEWDEPILVNCTSIEDNPVKIGRCDHYVELIGQVVVLSNITALNQIQIATLPEGYIPERKRIFSAARISQSATTVVPQLIIDTDGKVYLRNPGSTTLTASTNVNVAVNAMWMI